MQFTALIVEPDTNSTTANVLFADPETNPDEPSVLSFSRAVDIPDSAYYFEINDQSYGSYGGLEQVVLTRAGLAARVEPSVVERFGVAGFAVVQVEFEVDDALFESVRDTLRVIFTGTGVLVEG